MLKYIFYCIIFSYCILFSSYQFSLDSQYGVKANSTRAIGNLAAEQLNNLTLFLEKIDHQLYSSTNTSAKWASHLSYVYLLNSLFSDYHLATPFSLSYHEFGHASRLQAYQLNTTYHIKDYTYKNVFLFFLGVITNPDLDIASVSDYLDPSKQLSWEKNYKHLGYLDSETFLSNGRLFNFTEPILYPAYDAMATANGVNSEMYLSYLLSESAQKAGNISVFGAGAYFQNKLSVLKYVKNEQSGRFNDDSDDEGGGDLWEILNYYKQYHKLHLSFNDLKNYNTYAALASAQTWHYVYGLYQFFRYRNPKVPLHQLGKFELPETYFYLNTEGISYLLSSAYNHNKTSRYPFYIEHQFKGIRKTEFSIGLEKNWNKRLYTSSTIRKGVQWAFSHEFVYNWTHSFSTFLGFSHYSGKNLFGARHIPSLADPDLRDNESWFGLSYRFR